MEEGRSRGEEGRKGVVTRSVQVYWLHVSCSGIPARKQARVLGARVGRAQPDQPASCRVLKSPPHLLA